MDRFLSASSVGLLLKKLKLADELAELYVGRCKKMAPKRDIGVKNNLLWPHLFV